MSEGLVMLTVATAVVATEAVYLKNGTGFKMEPVIGGFILGGVLFLVSSINEGLGAAFCGLVIVASLLRNGSTLFGIASTATAKAKTTTKKG